MPRLRADFAASFCKFLVNRHGLIDSPIRIGPDMTMTSWLSHRMGLVLAVWLVIPALSTGQAESPLDRVKRAAAVSRELADMTLMLPAGENPTMKSRGLGPIFPNETGEESSVKVPFESAVRRYTAVRPWSSGYIEGPWREWPTAKAPQGPTPGDAPALRAMLEDESPDLRGLAVEALATLDQPEDAPRLAALLDDSTGSAPILARDLTGLASITVGDLPGDSTEAPKDSLDWSRRWQQRTVAAYAKDGLKLLTGREFDNKAAFHQWWKRNAEARHCLWYWQLRLQRTMDKVDYRPDFSSDVTEQVKQVAAAKIPVASQILEELKQLPPEVEAKVRLLTASNHAGGAPITGSEELFWPEAPKLRLPPERLLDLLDRKNLWDDVDWDVEHYNLFAERLGLWAHVLFKPQHAGRLRAALERERNELWWSGQAALIIGISRLHPAAKAESPDEVGTRDQILRDAAVKESDLFVRSYCAMELVRVGLPENAAFLQHIAFEPGKDRGSPDVMKGILQALARPPLDRPKRELLADIVLDDRFKDSWTRPNAQMGDDGNRTYAILAINAHAGRPLIPHEQTSALVNPATSAAELEKIRTGIRQLLEKP
jgi:hypothetical protein